jgi:hypothetical protein
MGGERVSTTLEVGGFRGTKKGSCCGMDVDIADNSQGTGRTIRQMDGEMPAERFRVEGSTRDIECHPNLMVQPAVDESNRFFFGSSSELWEGTEVLACDNFRHSLLLL